MEAIDRIRYEVVSYIDSTLGVMIDEQSKLPSALGIKGLDAYDFFISFFTKFDVDPTGFYIEEYDLDEQDVLSLFNFFKKRREKKEFDLDHLIVVVRKGKWLTPGVK